MNKFALFLIILSLLALGCVYVYIAKPFQRIASQNDQTRKQDIMKVAAALESYRNDYGRYPPYDASSYTIVAYSYNIAWGTPFNPYLTTTPKEKSPRRYVYWSDGQSFRLYAALERPQDEPKACGSLTADCPNVPEKDLCGPNLACNFGVTSGNVSP
ncbi:MAG: type II secretion system protein GspG [Candidatus Levyibacteriota bacterium]